MSDIEKDGSAVHQEVVATNTTKEQQHTNIVQPDIEEKNGIFKQHLLDWKRSIFRKPDRPVNMWHLLTNLNNKQRITFTAGKKKKVGLGVTKQCGQNYVC